MKITLLALSLIIACLSSCSSYQSKKHTKKLSSITDSHPEWIRTLDSEIEKLGSFNWIVIAEPSFPSYSKSGITTVTAPVNSAEALEAVFQIIDSHSHVRPRIYITTESQFISENETPGITSYRADIKRVFDGRKHQALNSAALELLLTDAKKKYKVLVIKTLTTLPYDSIYLELESGYWDGVSETSLRKRMIR